MRSSYGKVVGREEAPWWKWKRRVKSDRRVRDVWFQKLKEKSWWLRVGKKRIREKSHEGSRLPKTLQPKQAILVPAAV